MVILNMIVQPLTIMSDVLHLLCRLRPLLVLHTHTLHLLLLLALHLLLLPRLATISMVQKVVLDINVVMLTSVVSVVCIIMVPLSVVALSLLPGAHPLPLHPALITLLRCDYLHKVCVCVAVCVCLSHSLTSSTFSLFFAFSLSLCVIYSCLFFLSFSLYSKLFLFVTFCFVFFKCFVSLVDKAVCFGYVKLLLLWA